MRTYDCKAICPYYLRSKANVQVCDFETDHHIKMYFQTDAKRQSWTYGYCETFGYYDCPIYIGESRRAKGQEGDNESQRQPGRR